MELLIEVAVSVFGVLGFTSVPGKENSFSISLFLFQFYFWMTAVLGKVAKLSGVRERVRIRFCFFACCYPAS